MLSMLESNNCSSHNDEHHVEALLLFLKRRLRIYENTEKQVVNVFRESQAIRLLTPAHKAADRIRLRGTILDVNNSQEALNAT